MTSPASSPKTAVFETAKTQLVLRLRREPLLNSILKKRKELLHVGERRPGIIIVILQPMLVVVTFGQDFVNYKTSLLHRRASVREAFGHFFGSLLQRAIKAVGPLGCWTLPVVRAIPFGGRVENFASASYDADIALAHRRICARWTAELRVLRGERKSTEEKQTREPQMHMFWDGKMSSLVSKALQSLTY